MSKSEILLYQTEDGQTKIDVRLEEETVWLSQAQMSELFQKERSVITKHIKNVFEELLARIRDIRSSEKVFWRKVLDIYATSIDYDHSLEMSVMFFKTVQNKMHWAAHGHTAAETIYNRADSGKPNLGLSSFKGKKLKLQKITLQKTN